MQQQRSHHVAVWIDQRTAILIKYLGDLSAGNHQRHSAISPMCDGGWTEYRFGVHQYTHPKHFYDEIVCHLGPEDQTLILGPGEAKHILHQQISSHRGERGEVVEVQSAHAMTERELARLAQAYFGQPIHGTDESSGPMPGEN